jgi:hypothetical protein
MHEKYFLNTTATTALLLSILHKYIEIKDLTLAPGCGGKRKPSTARPPQPPQVFTA